MEADARAALECVKILQSGYVSARQEANAVQQAIVRKDRETPPSQQVREQGIAEKEKEMVELRAQARHVRELEVCQRQALSQKAREVEAANQQARVEMRRGRGLRRSDFQRNQ